MHAFDTLKNSNQTFYDSLLDKMLPQSRYVGLLFIQKDYLDHL